MPNKIPEHIAIIMDGNGRYAQSRGLPRAEGHRLGGDVARNVVRWCGEVGVNTLTLFAFGSDNWRRPQAEVDMLMELFLSQLAIETPHLMENNVQLKVIGDATAFNKALQRQITASESLTQTNTGLRLRIAANYGGYWDICEAAKACARAVVAGELAINAITPDIFASYLVTADVPLPDLFIRTSGEQRISNFLLWQLSYTELYFSEVMWPAFTRAEFDKALAFFSARERRFGATHEQLKESDRC